MRQQKDEGLVAAANDALFPLLLILLLLLLLLTPLIPLLLPPLLPPPDVREGAMRLEVRCIFAASVWEKQLKQKELAEPFSG